MEKELTDIEKFAAEMADKQDNPTIHKLVKAFPEKSYRELEIFRDAVRKFEETNIIPLTESQKKQEDLEPIEKGVCVPGALRKAREYAAEGESSTNRVKEAQDALANALEVNESHQKLNGRLQERVTELEAENKKMHDALDAHKDEVIQKLDSARKAGL